MAASFNPGPGAMGTFELLGSPRSERNYGGISPIAHTGRYSQPDLRFWDFIDQGGEFEELAQECEATEVALNNIGSDIQYVPVENPAYVAETVPYQQPIPSSATLLDAVAPISQAVAEDAAEPSLENVQQDVRIFEEITLARCIECDRIIDSRGATHDRSSCTLKKYFSCSKCDASFNFERNLDVHVIVEHSSQASYIPGSECTFCDSRRKGKTFQRYHAYLAHMKQHMKPDQFFCSACSAEFEYPNMLRRHRRLVHGMMDEEAGLESFSAELAYCPHCCSMVALEQVEAHRLLHSIHL
ncbi:zinc finger, C2H2 type [Oesophagostomum dentatum]|uniref:Zinc finger, C2H2 type n=1 Tax=Oesophagostomum dentatum TaxID=61180 RepID=A0A0B1TH92_OESDE|nr:zinc finger, C2H2 type [Oesophagostomum dentatum]